MKHYRFYRTVMAPPRDDFKKYKITRKIATVFSLFLMGTFIYELIKGQSSKNQQNLHSQKESAAYSETEIRDFHKNVPRSQKARTTSSSQFEQIMETNVALIRITNSDGSVSVSNTASLDSNMFLVTGHSIPAKGQFDICINYMKENSHLIAHEKLSQKDVYYIPGRDFCILHIPSSQPRKSLKEYLPYGKY
jgi:hypothetical protein